MKKHRKFTVVSGTAAKKKRNGRYKKSLFLLILLAVVVPAGRALFVYGRNALSVRLTRTVVAEEEVRDITVRVEGLVIREEHLARTPVTGTLEWLVSEGERVAVDTPVARIVTAGGEVPVTAPAAGILVWGLDGLEVVLSGVKLSQLEVAAVRELAPASKKPATGDKISQGSLLFKIINNFRWFYVLEVGPKEGVLLEGSDVHTLRFAGGRELTGGVVLRRTADDRVTLVYQLNEDLEEALQNRFITAEVVVSRLRGVVLPASVLVDREGRTGVYIVRESVVLFRAVDVLGKIEDSVVVKGVPTGLRVVVNPALVKEGQRL